MTELQGVEFLLLNEGLVHGVESADCHNIGGESAGLVSDDFIGTAHGLSRVDLSDQAVALLHLLNREGKGDSHG